VLKVLDAVLGAGVEILLVLSALLVVVAVIFDMIKVVDWRA